MPSMLGALSLEGLDTDNDDENTRGRQGEAQAQGSYYSKYHFQSAAVARHKRSHEAVIPQ